MPSLLQLLTLLLTAQKMIPEVQEQVKAQGGAAEIKNQPVELKRHLRGLALEAGKISELSPTSVSPILFSSVQSGTTPHSEHRSLAAKGPTIKSDPILSKVNQYPAVGGAYGPTFKLGTHMGVLVKGADWVKIRFGSAKGEWVELTLSAKPTKIAKSDYAKYGLLPGDPKQHFTGVLCTTSKDPVPKWYGDSAGFFYKDRASKSSSPKSLVLDIGYLAKGKPDARGDKFPSDRYSTAVPISYDENGLSYVPQYAKEDLSFDTTSNKFPFTSVKAWSGSFSSSFLKDSFINTFGKADKNMIGIAASSGATVIVSRSKANKALKVPVVKPTKNPTVTTKAPTKKPTVKKANKKNKKPKG